MKLNTLVLVCVVISQPLAAAADEIGSVDTKFILFGPDHEIEVDAFDDPKIEGATCYISRAKTGGIKGALGVAEDKSDASISCRQVGPIKLLDTLEEGENVFKERRSLIFKKLQVVRFCDTTRNAIVYLAYSDRLIEGSPQNSISSIPIMPWGARGDSTLAVCQYDD